MPEAAVLNIFFQLARIGLAGAKLITGPAALAGEWADTRFALVIDHVVRIAARIFCCAVLIDKAR